MSTPINDGNRHFHILIKGQQASPKLEFQMTHENDKWQVSGPDPATSFLCPDPCTNFYGVLCWQALANTHTFGWKSRSILFFPKQQDVSLTKSKSLRKKKKKWEIQNNFVHFQTVLQSLRCTAKHWHKINGKIRDLPSAASWLQTSGLLTAMSEAGCIGAWWWSTHVSKTIVAIVAELLFLWALGFSTQYFSFAYQVLQLLQPSMWWPLCICLICTFYLWKLLSLELNPVIVPGPHTSTTGILGFDSHFCTTCPFLVILF